MEVYMPAVEGPAEVASQTEASAVAEKVPTAGYLSGALKTEAGQVIVSQQLLDRAGPNFSFDKLIFDQLERDYAPKVDKYVLTEALANPIVLVWSGSSASFVLLEKEKAGGLYGQVAKAKAEVRTTEGTVLNPTHLFMAATRWEYIAAFGDANLRPVVVPDYAGPWNAVGAASSDGDVGIEGRTGYRLGGLPAFTDQNIPAYGTYSSDQVIVGDLAEVYVYEGSKVPRVIPQTYAQNLQTLLQLYSYITCIVRYPKAIAAIRGSALKTPVYTN
jgi:HK97 family phage major capsid protein